MQGPLALSWLMRSLARRMRGRDRRQMLEQADILAEEALVMRKLRKSWSQSGVTDPWLVVYPEREPCLPRYLPEPALSGPWQCGSSS